MTRRYRSSLLALSAIVLSMFATETQAQSRAVGAQQLIVDDGTSNTITLAAPAGMAGDINVTLPSTSGKLVSTSGTPANGDVITYSAGAPTWQAPVPGLPSGSVVGFFSNAAQPGYTLTNATQQVGLHWVSKAAIPVGRLAAGVSVVGGKIYMIGGANASPYLNANERYDPATNAWSTLTSMPTARQGVAAAAVNNIIYVIGGNSGGITNVVEAYDPATDTWSTKTSMPTARTMLSCAAVNGKIYVIGGLAGGGESNKVEEYDPATDSWSTKATMPSARANMGVAEVDGNIYTIGGGSFPYLDNVEMYDPATNTWSTKTAMPTPRTALACAVLNGKIYATGGSNGPTLSLTQVYDPAMNSWSSFDPMLDARYYHQSIELGGKVYAISGAGAANAVESLEPMTIYYFVKN